MLFQYDTLVFIGRFQPFHLAHYQTVKIALTQAKHVILCLGSAQPERSLKNPFLATERESMILANFKEDERQRISFAYIIDVYNDQKWKNLVKQEVQRLTSPQERIGLIGHNKDESSYYLALFPEWESLELESLHQSISATPLREAYYQGQILKEHFPQGTIQFLEKFKQTMVYAELVDQFNTM